MNGKKGVKISYTKEQLLTLESLFGQNNYPDILEREEIAAKLKLEEKNVHVSLHYTYIKIKCGKYIFFCSIFL